MITIELCSNEQRIENYLRQCDKSMVYSSPRFVRLVSEHLKAEYNWILAIQRNEVVGILPYLIKDGELGPVYNSMAYFGSNGGVSQNVENKRAKIALIKAFYENAEANDASSATIISNPLMKDSHIYAKYSKYNYLDERIGQITQIGECEQAEDLIKMFQSPRPRNIRKAIKQGVVVNKGNDSESINFLYQTHIQNMRVIGGIPKEKSFFYSLAEKMLHDEWKVYVGTIQGKPVAALLVLYFNKTVEYFTPVVLESYRSTQALSLIIYSAMQDAIELGYDFWNWGGTWLSQGGVYDFKKRWGTLDLPYYYYTRIFNQQLQRVEKSYLLSQYSGFYVVPFSALEN